MRRLPVPSVIKDVFDDPVARTGLFVGAIALAAAALDPKVWGPALPSVQAAVRERPQVEVVTLLAAVVSSGILLLGGAIGDTARARPIVLWGLVVELLASVVSLLVPSGPLFVATRLLGYAASAFVIPVSIALVATSYQGIARATAIGLAYGAYSAAGAAAPILLQLIPDQRAPAFIVAIVVCGVAIWFVRNRIPELTRPTTAERPYVVGTAIWAFGIITLTVGITWIGGGLDNPVRWALVIGGFAVIGLGVVHDRRGRQPTAGPVRIDRRPVAVAIFVGIVIAIAQTVPMLELPLYFRFVMGFGPVAAVVAVAPLFAALVLAGPVAGYLLSHYSPRTLVGAGVIAVGLANLALFLASTPSVSYLAFVVPCLLIGAGFVIATTVRTAIIFASVPRGLPATAAALNESSISVGNRVGIVLVTAIVADRALAAYTASVAGLPQDEAQRAISAFRDLLTAVGTPSFSQVASAVNPADVRPFLEAYASGVRAAFALGGLAAVLGGAVAWIALGRRDPLTSVWEHSDEREPAGG